MGESKCTLEELECAISDMRRQVTVKLSNLGASELALVSESWKELKHADSYRLGREVFVKQFEGYNPVYQSHYFYNDVEREIQKETELPANERASLGGFFTRHIRNTKQERDIITKRISDIEVFKKFRIEYENYMKNVALHLYDCEIAIKQLEIGPDVSLSSRQLVNALVAEFSSGIREFPLKAIRKTMKLMPLVHKKEIAETAFDRLVADVKESKVQLPQYPTSETLLEDELVRLTTVLNVDFDISAHDKHRFYYLCDKLFADFFRNAVNLPELEAFEPSGEHIDLADVLDSQIVKRAQKSRLAESMFEQFSILPVDEVTNILAIVVSRRLNECKLTREKMMSMLKLEFVRNRKLLSDIVTKVQAISEIRKRLHPDDTMDYTAVTIGRIKTCCTASLSCMFDTIPSTVSKEQLFEEFVSVISQYLDAKLDALAALEFVLRHVVDESSVRQATLLIDDFPVTMACQMLSPLQNLRIGADECRAKADFISTLVRLQTMHEMRYADEIPNSLIDIELNGCDPWLPSTNYFPHSPFHVFGSLAKISQFMAEVPGLAREIGESFSTMWLRMENYFKIAVWKQLLHELIYLGDEPMRTYESLSIGHLGGIDKNVMSFVTMKYLTEWDEMQNLVDSVDGDKRPKLILSARRFVMMSNKLRILVYASRSLLQSYCQQREMSPLGIDAMSDIVRFMSDAVSFDDTHGIIKTGDFSGLRGCVDAQRRFNAMLSVAIRFNNFYVDSNTVSSYFGVSDDVVPYDALTGVNFEDDSEVRRFAAGYAIVGVSHLRESELAKLFCNIRDVPDLGNANRIVNTVLPFAYRIELANIALLDRQFFAEVSSLNGYLVDTDDVLIADDMISPIVVPGPAYYLALDTSNDVLQTLIKFTSVRNRLFHIMRLVSCVSHRKTRILEGICGNCMPWDARALTTLNNEIAAIENCDMHIITARYEERETYYMNLVYSSILQFLNEIYGMTDMKRKRALNESRSEERIKALWRSMNYSFWSPAKSLTKRRYLPAWYDHIMFQLDDYTRAEVGAQLQDQDASIHDRLLAAEGANAASVQASFVREMLICGMLRCVYVLMHHEQPMSVMNSVSAVCDITEKMFKDHTVEYQNRVIVEANKRLGADSRKSGTEMSLLKECHEVLVEVVDAHAVWDQKRDFDKDSAERTAKISEAMSSPNAMLRPDNTTKTEKRGKRPPLRVPAPVDSEKQFQSEIRFSLARVIHSVLESVAQVKPSDGDMIVYKRAQLQEWLDEVSMMIEFICTDSVVVTQSTWDCYIQHAMRQFYETIGSISSLDRMMKGSQAGFQALVDYDVSLKMKQDVFKLNTLRFQENMMNQSRRREELQMTREIKESFEDLVACLSSGIVLTKKAYFDTYAKYYNGAIRPIEKLLSDPDAIPAAVSGAKIGLDSDRREQQEREHQELTDLIRKMRISRCIERIGSTYYYTRRIAKVGEEKKTLSASMWFGRRQFEEDQRVMQREVDEECQRLTNCEIEIDSLSKELEEERRTTAKLIHSRGMSVKRYDIMVKEEKELERFGDVNVSQVLQDLEKAHEELEMLIEETDAMDDQVTFEIREPMVKRDQYRRRVALLESSNLASTERIKLQEKQANSPFLTKLERENEDLAAENEDLKLRIERLEAEKASQKPESLQLLEGLFDPAPKPPLFPRRTVAAIRIVRPNGQPKIKTPRAT